MKHVPLSALVAITLATFLSAGCALFSRRSAAAPDRPRAYALAVTVNGVLQPTPAQWAAVQAKLAQELNALGYVLVTDLALADKILRIDFTPNPNDPENSGHARLLSVRDNPLTTLVTTTSVGRYPTSFSYAGTFQNPFWNYGYANNSFYSWNNSYYDGFSYGSANLSPISPPVTTRPTNPPRRHHDGHDHNCPSPSDNYIRPIPVRLAGDYSANPPNDHPRTPPSGGHRRWSGGDSSGGPTSPTYARSESSGSGSSGDRSSRWRSESSGSGSGRTYSRSESSGSRSDRGSSRSGDSGRSYSRSDSSSSYSRSEPSNSSSSSSSSYSDSSSSSYSSSSSSGSSFSSSSESAPSAARETSSNTVLR